VLAREKPDFVQIDYSLDDREVEKRILPLAAEVKAGVLTALPFGRARLFRAVRGKDIPDWARGFAESWGHFFLKYLLPDPRVTALIPGTADPAHMTDNLGTMRGPLPDLSTMMGAISKEMSPTPSASASQIMTHPRRDLNRSQAIQVRPDCHERRFPAMMFDAVKGDVSEVATTLSVNVPIRVSSILSVLSLRKNFGNGLLKTKCKRGGL
jgi:predicted aldo/keto reductase-like oxidoreductase